jgi:hypothetical protein
LACAVDGGAPALALPRCGSALNGLGSVISQAIVHHYGRDDLLRRLSNPFRSGSNHSAR